ncbi:Spc24 subunit of Ndc80-domain-containing protein [Umbelopsis sp. PMI_123]|nr:Spc24 subunit of Ndc80-domain-containing protein [Umbelopsis sp. PMI_123]
MDINTASVNTSFDELHLLIRRTAEKFSPESDLALVQNTRETMQRVNEVRAKQHYHSQEEMRALMRQLEEARIQATRPNDVVDDREHIEALAQKDKEKYHWANQALELENENHTLEAQIQSLRGQIEDMEAQEVKVEDTIDKTTLQLQIYRGLGIELLDDGNGHFVKARIHSTRLNDLNTLPLNDKYSPFFYSNYLWEMCS